MNTPFVAAGPKAPLRSNLADPEEWKFTCSDGGVYDEHAMISSFPVSAVGGTSGQAVVSSFSAEVTAPSPSPLRYVTSTPEPSGESYGTGTLILRSHNGGSSASGTPPSITTSADLNTNMTRGGEGWTRTRCDSNKPVRLMLVVMPDEGRREQWRSPELTADEGSQ